MSVQRVLPIFLACAVLVKLSKQEKHEDCIKGKQYWSKSFLNPSGTCAGCPPLWTSCYNEPIQDQKRCIVSCRVKPIPTFAPTSSYIPPELSKAIPTPSIPVVYHSAVHPDPVETNEDEPRAGNDENHHIKIVLIIVASVLSVCAFLGLVAVVLLVRSRKRSPRNRGNAGRNDAEVCVPLHKFQPNDREERLQPNDEEEHLQQIDVEERVQPRDAEERVQPNVVEERLQPNDVEELLQMPNADAEERVAPQEIQPPIQANPSSLRIGGIQDSEKDNCSSSLDVQTEVEN